MFEHKTLEFKEDVTNSFLKTVSAYSNFCTGEIVFGISDDGTIRGLSDPEKIRLDLENRINDSISPKPDFSFKIDTKKKILTLTVYEGDYKPYLYKGKAYRRADTASIEVDNVELKRLILEGEGRFFDQTPASSQELQFNDLISRIKNILDVETVDINILKTLDLYNSKTGYNRAAEILADQNNCPAIDIARFTDNDDEIRERILLKGKSILVQFDEALKVFKRNYTSEVIENEIRTPKEDIPYIAFREAIANAIIHRTWDVNANIRVAMYPDKVEVYSPGGLPSYVKKEEYLNGGISILRNPILSNVLFRLKYVEIFGTGIKRIKRAYKDIGVEPIFEITDNSIKVILPSVARKTALTMVEKELLDKIPNDMMLKTSELCAISGYSKNKVLRTLSTLIDKKYIKKTGAGSRVRYIKS